MKIQRYNIEAYDISPGDPQLSINEESDGLWVRYDDIKRFLPQENSLKDGQAKGIPTDQEIDAEFPINLTGTMAVFNSSMMDKRYGAKWLKNRLQENSRESRQEPSEGE